MAGLSGFETRNCYCLTTRRGHFKERCSSTGSKQDGSVAIPGASPSDTGVGQRLWHAAHDIDAFQFAIGKKSYGPAVRRPERIACTFRSRKRLWSNRIQWPDPELRFAFVRCREH